MAVKTGIEWTDSTWNPLRGCSRVSEGCRNCYAELVAARFSGSGQAYEGLARRRSNGEPQWTGEVRVIDAHMLDPIRWRRPRKIFVNSMSDLFHENVSIETIARVWAVMALAPHHTYQILTKRPGRMREVLSDEGFYNRVLVEASGFRRDRPKLMGIPISDPRRSAWYPHVWLGVSVENQAAADERIPLLLNTPAAVRFLSCEPLLEGVNLRLSPRYICTCTGGCRGRAGLGESWGCAMDQGQKIDWVIIGGESGPHARPMNIEWARSLVAQCKGAGVAPFVKQLGAWVAGDDAGMLAHRWLFEDGRVWVPGVIGEHIWKRPEGAIAFQLGDSHGGNIRHFPEDLRIREFPHTEATV